MQTPVKPALILLVCGRFHFHKYIHLLASKGILSRFFYSYRINFTIEVSKKIKKNFLLKEYGMYAGAYFLKGKKFFRWIKLMHDVWQWQVRREKIKGNIVHFLVHGNCYKIINQYKRKGFVIIGEVVNAHPDQQEIILKAEYAKWNLKYNAGEQYFSEKIKQEYLLCDHLLVASTYLKNSLVREGFAENRISVVPYAIDPKDCKKKSSWINRDSHIKLLYVGQITPRKGVIYLLKAFQQLYKTGLNCSLTIVGSVDDIYQPVTASYFSLPGITHLNHVDNNSITDVMLDHDLFIMPSIEDGFGIVVSEALSVNLPVIVTSNCGSAEIIKDGKNGFVIPPFSESAIVNAVISSIEHSFEFEEINITWQHYVDRLEKFYTGILN